MAQQCFPVMSVCMAMVYMSVFVDLWECLLCYKTAQQCFPVMSVCMAMVCMSVFVDLWECLLSDGTTMLSDDVSMHGHDVHTHTQREEDGWRER